MKKLNKFQMAAIKRTAANTKKLVKQKNKTIASIDTYQKILEDLTTQINEWEAPALAMTDGWPLEDVIAWDGNIPESDEEFSLLNDIKVEDVDFEPNIPDDANGIFGDVQNN